MTIQNENNSSELIDIKAETAKNEAAIAGVIKDSPGMSSFFGGSGGGGADTEYGGAPSAAASRQSSEVEHFMTAGISAGGKKAEMAKQGVEVLFDSGSKGQSMFFSGGKKGGSFNISYAGEKGAGQKGPVKQQSTPLVDPGYFAKSRQARKGGNTVDKNHIIAANVTAAGNAVAGKSYGHGGASFTPTISQPSPETMRQLSHLCHTLLQDKNTLHQLQNGPMSRNRLIQDLQDGKEGAEQQLRSMTGGQKVEAFRNMAPSVKKDILDGPGT